MSAIQMAIEGRGRSYRRLWHSPRIRNKFSWWPRF